MGHHAIWVSSLLVSPFFLGASTPSVQNTLAHVPLHFETAADGSLVSHQGPYGLVVQPGRTTVTVADRAHRRMASVTTRLTGASGTSRPAGEDPLAARASYFLGTDPAAWRTGATLYSRAVERDVYRGIDLVFHGDGGALEYDFLVHPGANAREIALDVSGASALRLDPDGALAIGTAAGEIRWKKPEVYQWKDGVRRAVTGAFALHGRRVSFALGAYDHTRDLVIDPTLAYGTYLGGNDNEGGRGVAVDSSGNIYVAGFSFSMNLAVTAGTVQTAWHGATNSYGDVGGDAFIAKYTAAGALSYLTYLGGAADDAATAIAVDAQGNAYVTGFTASSGFPTVKGSLQTTFGGAGSGAYYTAFGDAFVAKLNPTGNGTDLFHFPGRKGRR
ncbi:MAG: SBBP repeat-containing protein [Ignavibacteriota bacterium]